MSNRQVKVGDTVYWFSSLAANARPWPAVVLAVNPGTTRREAGKDVPAIPVLDLNVHQPNRLAHRQATFHRSEPQLQRWLVQDLTTLGCWLTIDEFEQTKAEADAALAAAAAENQRKLQEQEESRLLEEQTNPSGDAPSSEQPAGAKPDGKGKQKSSAAA